MRVTFAAALCICAMTTGAAAVEQPRAFWALDRDEGESVTDRVGERIGLRRAGGRVEQEGEAPRWGEVDGEPALTFPGGGTSGLVQVDEGGRILSGPQFQLALEVWPEDAGQAAFLLACKFDSRDDGGFALFYWGLERRFMFQFADGHRTYRFSADLPERLSEERWTPIRITYDGRWLTIEVDGETVERFHRPGLELTESDRPLTIGSYHQGGQAFAGHLRNVALGTPRSRVGPDLAYTLTPAAQPPIIDGRLSDPAWEEAQFVDGFTDEHGDAADPDTQFAITRDDQRLYLAIRAAHPEPEALNGTTPEERIELRLDPEYGLEHELHITLTAAGAAEGAVRRPDGELIAAELTPELDSGTARTEEGWTGEWAIPFESLLVQPEASGPWLFNVTRAHRTPEGEDRRTTWGRPQDGDAATGLRALHGDLQPVYDEGQIQAVRDRRDAIGLDVEVYHEPLALQPIGEQMVVANNLTVPNWFRIRAPMEQVMTSETQFLLDLPEGVDLIAAGGAHVGTITGGTSGRYTFERVGEVTHNGQAYTRHRIVPIEQHPRRHPVGPLFLTSDLPDGARTRIYYSSAWDDGETEPQGHPLTVRRFPTPGQPQGLYHTIGSNRAAHVLGWPQFIQSYGQLGFNGVSIHSKWDTSHESAARLPDLSRRDL